jgi:hypothetical protein
MDKAPAGAAAIDNSSFRLNEIRAMRFSLFQQQVSEILERTVSRRKSNLATFEGA